MPLPELVPVDIARKEHKTEAFTRINPQAQRLPVLELDDGTALAETTAICRYIEALHPQPTLFGRDAKEQATIEMWNRRVELGLFASVAAVFRHSHPSMAELEEQVPEWAEANRDQIDDHLWLLELQLASNAFVCGDVLDRGRYHRRHRDRFHETLAHSAAGGLCPYPPLARRAVDAPKLEGVMSRILLVLLAFLAPISAAGAVERLSGEAIERAFRGNTVFDHYHSTNTPENRFYSYDIYEKLVPSGKN